MTFLKGITISVLVASFLMVGCADSRNTNREDVDEHMHGRGPNDGVIIGFGPHHAEVSIDRAQQECTVVMLGEDAETPISVTASEIVVNTDAAKTAEGIAIPSMTITLKPADRSNGKATRFIGTDPGLVNFAKFSGFISGEIDGEMLEADFQE
jgi:hypothetical protein